MKRGRKTLVTLGIAAVLAAAPVTQSYALFAVGNTQKLEPRTETEVEYAFKSGETVIAMGAEAAGILSALGQPSSTFERESCAYQGKDKVYTYEGFELSTYPVDGKDYVSSVYLLDDTAATQEGIKIGSSKEDVLRVYGDGYDAEEAKFGTYTYTDDGAQLKVYTRNDVVDGIEYLVVPQDAE